MFVYTVKKGFKEQIQPAIVLDIDHMYVGGWVMIQYGLIRLISPN